MEFTDFAYRITGGTVSRTEPDRWGKNDINALEMGAGTTGDAIQAAIDAAYNRDIARVRIPYVSNSRWTISNPIFQDVPGNLRQNLTKAQLLSGQVAPVTSAGPCISVEADWGTRFYVTFNTAPAWWIGSGSGGAAGNHVSGVNLTNGVRVENPRQHPENCTGFAIASEGGAGTIFEACSASSFYSGFRTGQNNPNGSLAESNKFLYCTVSGCYNGIWFYSGQGLVNLVFGCNIGATRAFRSLGADYLVIGGEHGQSQSQRKACMIKNVSTLKRFMDVIPGGATFTNFRFTATILSSDRLWTACPDGGFVYNSATINLPSFGIVPLATKAYNPSTGQATFHLDAGWTWYYYGQEVQLDTGTAFNDELQACATLYAVERCTYSEGSGHFIGAHYENQSLTALHDTLESTAGYDATFENMRINSDPAISQYSDNGNPDDLAVFYGAQAHPWIRQTGNVRLINSSLPSSKVGDHLVIEGTDYGDDNSTARLIVENSRGLFHPNLRYIGHRGSSYLPEGRGYPDPQVSLGQFGSKAFGFGEWDRTPWGPNVNAGPPDILPYDVRAGGTSTVRYLGFRPSPSETPRLTIADVNAITSPTVPGAQVLMCGGTMHVITQIGPQSYSHIKDFGGEGFSYYADLAIDWSYRGQTHKLSLSGPHAHLPFAGLEIGLDNGDGIIWYIVTGYYRRLAYLTVYRESTSSSLLAGEKNTIYRGTIVKQRAASLQKYGAPI
jgi:hypothetical protein